VARVQGVGSRKERTFTEEYVESLAVAVARVLLEPQQRGLLGLQEQVSPEFLHGRDYHTVGEVGRHETRIQDLQEGTRVQRNS